MAASGSRPTDGYINQPKAASITADRSAVGDGGDSCLRSQSTGRLGFGPADPARRGKGLVLPGLSSFRHAQHDQGDDERRLRRVCAIDQSTNVALVPGQDAYVKIESLGSWSTFVGAGYVAARDTFYARLMLPQIARSEIVQSFFDGGS
jgi:hypothetical protein